MTIQHIRELPGFMAAWPGCRDTILEYLNRKQLKMSADNVQQTGQQAIAKLILELEELDVNPTPIVRPKMKKLSTM